MRTLFLLSTFLFLGITLSSAQSNNRVSPMDSIENHIENTDVKVIYSRPFLKGRKFGKDIVPFGKVWRTGANEATVFEINRAVKIDGHLLNAGKYSLYTIPDEEITTVIFNKDWDQWGLKYNEKQDALRVRVPTYFSDVPIEQFTINIDDDGEVCLSWGDVIFMFEVESEENLVRD